MKIFVRIWFVLYALFLALCAYTVWYDPPGQSVVGRSVGAGMAGFLAAAAAGFPWSVLLFPLGSICESMRHPAVCGALLSDQGFTVMCGIAAVVNLVCFGVVAFGPRKKGTVP